MGLRKADSSLVPCRKPGQVRGRAPRRGCGVGPHGRREGPAGVASLLPVSRWGVAGNRHRAVFCQETRICMPRLIAFNGSGRPAQSGVPRRHQDMKHER